jgi:hypothetical protein
MNTEKKNMTYGNSGSRASSSDVTNKRTLYYVKNKIAMTNNYQYLQNEQLHLTLKSLNTKTTMTCG